MDESTRRHLEEVARQIQARLPTYEEMHPALLATAKASDDLRLAETRGIVALEEQLRGLGMEAMHEAIARQLHASLPAYEDMQSFFLATAKVSDDMSGVYEAITRDMAWVSKGMQEALTSMVASAAVERFSEIAATPMLEAVTMRFNELRIPTDMVGSILGLHTYFADIGSTFAVSLGEETSAAATTYHAQFALPAGMYEADPDKYQVDTSKYTTDPSKYQADYDNYPVVEEPIEATPPNQIVQLNTLEANISTVPLSIVSSNPSWKIERSHNSEGLHAFHFYGTGGHEMGHRVSLIADFTHWVMGKDEESLEQMAARLFSIGESSQANELPPRARTGKTREETERIASLLKSLKDANPHLSYQGLAMKANKEYEEVLGIVVNENIVRYAYRVMGWPWQRADKIR